MERHAQKLLVLSYVKRHCGVEDETLALCEAVYDALAQNSHSLEGIGNSSYIDAFLCSFCLLLENAGIEVDVDDLLRAKVLNITDKNGNIEEYSNVISVCA